MNRVVIRKLSIIVLLCFNVFTFSQTTTKRIQYELPAVHEGDEIVEHSAYTLSYKENYEQAEWVAYMLTAEMTNGNIRRTNRFVVDPDVPTGSASPRDYSGSGYDKGHLAPAADMSWSEKAMNECFYMSNMSPQEPGFNRGIWKRLEEAVRRFAQENDTIYVTTGPILKPMLPTIGNNVAVPKYFYKVIVVYKQKLKMGIGFVLANESSNENLEHFAVSIDSVETLTGINFFSKIPSKIQKRIESTCDINKWFN